MEGRYGVREMRSVQWEMPDEEEKEQEELGKGERRAGQSKEGNNCDEKEQRAEKVKAGNTLGRRDGGGG